MSLKDARGWGPMGRVWETMDKLCTYERCEGYDWDYVWFHKPVYKGREYAVAVLRVFSGEVEFYDTWEGYMEGVCTAVDKVYLGIRREKKWDDATRNYVNYTWSINFARGYTKVLTQGEWEAYRIQRAWRRCVSNPEYRVCRGRLEREYGEM